MKLLFTADVHLCSAFGAEDSATRNRELLAVFKSIIDDGVKQGVGALILGGDLFDTPAPDEITVSQVRSMIENSGIPTYAIAGNHDPLCDTAFYSDPPKNTFVFGKNVQSVDIGGVTLVGASVYTKTDCRNIFEGITVPQGSVLVCHGSIGSESGHFLSREAIANSGASICLMGHIHKTERFDMQGVQALYCGSPSGRGFDELGQHGYYIVDTELKSFTYCKTSAKIYKEYDVDITDCASSSDIVAKLQEVSPRENEIARARLTGETDGSFYIDLTSFASLTDFVEIKDCTEVFEDILKNENSDTLEGEFIRILRAMAEKADESEKQKIKDAIKEGITLLRCSK